jgi:hypothetical protein
MGVAKLEGTPIPLAATGLLKNFDYLAVTGKSNEKGGSGSLRIGFAQKDKNSLRNLLELAPLIMMFMADAPPNQGQGEF